MYDLEYTIAADVDLLMRLQKNSIKHKKYTAPTVVMRSGGKSDVNFIRGRWEYFKIYLKYYNNPLLGLLGLISTIVLYLVLLLKKKVL
jgi:hypothetical protein